LRAQTDAQQFMAKLEKARQFSSERKWSEALPLWRQITEQNPVNGEYWSQLGTALYSVKDYLKSIDAYKKQIQLGHGAIGAAAYNIACNYALAGNKKEALDWLAKALYTGFNNISHARKDEDLTSLHSEAAFKKLLGTDDVSKMTRAEGWRYDLDLLKQEVKRKAYIRKELSLGKFERQFDEIYNSISKKTDIQLILEIMKLMTIIDDGHTSVFPPSRKEFQMVLPVQFYFFEEGLYIVAADQTQKDIVGAQVLGFDSRSVDDVATTMSKMISRDNDMNLMQNLASAIRHTAALHAAGLTKDPNRIALEIIDSRGEKRIVQVKADTLAVRVDHKSVPAGWFKLHENLEKPVPLYLKNLSSNYWFERIPDNKAIYMQWNSVRNDKHETLNNFTDRLMSGINDNNIEKLVIDLRWNNGGNTMLLPYFINALIKNENINKRGNLYVITGRRTFSAAQNLATFLERHTNAIFIGEPTGSRPNFVGEEDFITLPYSKLALNVSDLFWQSSWPWDKRVWIAPSVYIPPTFKAYSQNEDEVLNAILNF
jgi:hypothetical protein